MIIMIDDDKRMYDNAYGLEGMNRDLKLLSHFYFSFQKKKKNYIST